MLRRQRQTSRATARRTGQRKSEIVWARCHRDFSTNSVALLDLLRLHVVY